MTPPRGACDQRLQAHGGTRHHKPRHHKRDIANAASHPRRDSDQRVCMPDILVDATNLTPSPAQRCQAPVWPGRVPRHSQPMPVPTP
jgi:hypothetical protein